MKPPFTTQGLDHIVLRVRDLEQALAFYTRVLDGHVERKIETVGLYQVRLGRSLIDLVPVDSSIGRLGGAAPGAEGRNLEHFALRIEPFDAEGLRAHLEAHGITPSEVATRYGADGYGPSLYLSDPDGNTVELKGAPTGPG